MDSTAKPVPQTNTDVWVVVPAFNEGRRLHRTLDELCRSYSQVVVVDDGSADDTATHAASFPVWLLRHVVNCGQGAALQTGIDFAISRGAQVVVTFDADGQHVVDDVARLIDAVRNGFDVALGSRFLGSTEGMPWLRWLVLKAGVFFTRFVSRIAVTDTHNGLRAFSRSAAARIRITENRMAHASEILHQIQQFGLNYCEQPVSIRYNAATLAKGQPVWNSVGIAGHFLLGRLVR